VSPSDDERDFFLERLSAPQDPGAIRLFHYWRDKHEGATLPQRKAIDLAELARLRCADRVFILDPVGDGEWRYRLLGTEIVRYYGRDVTGIPLSRHMAPEEARQANEISDEVARTLQPAFLRARFRSGDFGGDIETMSLPIYGRDGNTIWLFGGTFFSREL
jgi:hypothetical protein